MTTVRVQHAPFDVGAELALLDRLGGGAVASFTGIVRGQGGLVELFLEHHPVMTAAALQRFVDEAEARWPLVGATVIHRCGALAPGEAIVLVATASLHRAAALDACAYLIDRLKVAAPFWKRERFADGTERWVEARVEDDRAAASWQDQPSRAETRAVQR
ncbi:molybdenum cofactor biosynthesis protein MoaE [Sphingomonas nostoxanthinifaciens]|uniref:molybdenum cofactor biosynthesis protein MoaE n=1 Tax=Sphingomonas nostoxanthinifaciens TaxID=2872652 RepID=UPI001CC1D015|nr:molybdenum cofactor biosynthesis protein MoaE [Sphingomonas nostoxanthinifaciens]UAK23947.1 molybdenum cofactor biosynthesis protein MoaE [Sphingomonas nostoxanthinifaciens]